MDSFLAGDLTSKLGIQAVLTSLPSLYLDSLISRLDMTPPRQFALKDHDDMSTMAWLTRETTKR